MFIDTQMVQEILFCLILIGLQITAKKMTDIIDELADLMKERNVDLAKAYELINGGKISKGIKKEINLTKDIKISSKI